MIYKYIIIILLLFSMDIGISKDLKIIDMEGTYDLDGDGQYEFAAVEFNRLNGHTISMIRYYEIDIDGYQNLLWELEMPDGLLGSFVGVKLADIIGDGVPELVAVANLSSNGDERIELCHKAGNRSIFANGAIKAAIWIVKQKPGLYSMKNIFQK